MAKAKAAGVNTRAIGKAKTEAQGKITPVFGASGGRVINVDGFKKPPSSTFPTFRQMNGCPTLAMARVAVSVPIRMSKPAFEQKEGKAPAGAMEFIQSEIEKLWPVILPDIMRALDYGYQAFEKVWEVRDTEQGQKLVLNKLKPLLPDLNEILIDKRTGDYRGIKQDKDKVQLNEDETFIFVNDKEGTDWYGRARHENAKPSWSEWMQLTQKEGMYVTKSAGVIPMIQYPAGGQSADINGKLLDNYTIALGILEQLGHGYGVTMPKIYSENAGDLARAGVNPESLLQWTISFLTPGSGFGGEFIEMMRHKEVQMLRSWFVPERAITEGQYGTKAEAETHGDLSGAISSLLLTDIIRAVNEDIVDPMLTLNYGENARGTVFIKKSGLTPELEALYTTIVTAVLANPQNVDLLMSFCKVNTMLDELGVARQDDSPETVAELPQKEVPPELGGGTPEQQAIQGKAQQNVAIEKIAASIYGAVREPAKGKGQVSIPKKVEQKVTEVALATGKLTPSSLRKVALSYLSDRDVPHEVRATLGTLVNDIDEYALGEDQPRAPAGTPEGGQWIAIDGAAPGPDKVELRRGTARNKVTLKSKKVMRVVTVDKSSKEAFVDQVIASVALATGADPEKISPIVKEGMTFSGTAFQEGGTVSYNPDPAAWKDENYPHGLLKIDMPAGASGKGSLDRSQTYYHTKAAKVAKVKNMKKVAELRKKSGAVMRDVKADQKTNTVDLGDGKTRVVDTAKSDSALMTELIESTGMRVGAKGNAGAKGKTYGASTLLPEHIVTRDEARKSIAKQIREKASGGKDDRAAAWALADLYLPEKNDSAGEPLPRAESLAELKTMKADRIDIQKDGVLMVPGKAGGKALFFPVEQKVLAKVTARAGRIGGDGGTVFTVKPDALNDYIDATTSKHGLSGITSKNFRTLKCTTMAADRIAALTVKPETPAEKEAVKRDICREIAQVTHGSKSSYNTVMKYYVDDTVWDAL